MECPNGSHTHLPWNKGKLVGQKAPLKPREVWAIRTPLQMDNRTREAVETWMRKAALRSDDYLFPSRVRRSPDLGTRQYARLLDGWVLAVGLDPAGYGTHSMRRAKAALIYRRTRNPRAAQLQLGHSKLESTVRYLGIEVDDALELAEQTDI
jgi:site-specific recombinase XerD